MDEYINIIVENHKDIFGNNPSINRINVGFTNTIYNVNDLYIVKICSDINNEKEFIKEIEFYNKNKDNILIPKLYYSNTSKEEIPYIYEVLEKAPGITLYHVWHTFSEEKRKDIINQICEAMKKMHSNIGKYYDWVEYNKNIFNELFQKVKDNNTLDEKEQELLFNAYNLFDKYLKSDEVVLIHNDLHFDNVLIDNNTIKIIDFERSMYAPKDYDLLIIDYMIQRPWKHANEECEKYTKKEDYENIYSYMKEFYPELFNIPYLEKRIAIYTLLYELDHLVRFYPKYYDELKNAVITNANKVIE